MKRKIVSGIMLPLLFIGMLTLAFNIQPVKAGGTIYIKADESANSLMLARETDTIANYMEGTVRTVEPPWTIWTRYHNYSEIVETLLYLNSTYPNIVNLFSIGKSWENRDIYCIRLTNEDRTYQKPKVFFVGYHHARELISAELPLYFVVHAATGYGVNATITRMLDFTEIYVIVALNVDGFDAFEANDLQRKNAHPFDEDGDGLLDEDPPDDEDGDGCVESGEGIDDDGDGLFNEDWIGGVDLNRNYGYHWGEPGTGGSPDPSSQVYRGPTPFSEPETQAIRDWLAQHSFKYAISFHSGLEGIGYPWCYTDTPPPDEELFREIAGNLSDLVNAPFIQGGALQKNSGTWLDWMYGNRSAIAFILEIFSNASACARTDFNPGPAQIETVILRWLPVFTYLINRAISEEPVHYVFSRTATYTWSHRPGPVFGPNTAPFSDKFNITFSEPDANGVKNLTVPKESYYCKPAYDPVGEAGFPFTWQLNMTSDGYGKLYTLNGTGDVDIKSVTNDAGTFFWKDGWHPAGDEWIGDGRPDPAGSSWLYLPVNVSIYAGNGASGRLYGTFWWDLWLTTGFSENTIQETASYLNGFYMNETNGRPYNATSGIVTYVTTGARLNIHYYGGVLDLQAKAERSGSPEPALMVSLFSHANLYVTDPENRHIGTDPTTGEPVNEIPRAFYTGPGSHPQRIIISDPLDGVYDIRLIGTSTGEYTLVVELATLEKTTTHIYTGDITPGEILISEAKISEGEMTSTQPVPLPPVGGIYIPVSKLSLLALYIGLTILLAVAVVTVGYVKKRKRNTETISQTNNQRTS